MKSEHIQDELQLIDTFVVAAPRELQHLVCSCYRATHYKPSEVTHPKQYLLCSICDLFQKYLVRQCYECDDIFIYNFKHPAFDPREQRCWNCLEHFTPDDICNLYGEKWRTTVKSRPYELLTGQTELFDFSFDFEKSEG